MEKTEIEALIAYGFWADGQIFQACERVSPADFVRQAEPDPGWHSLRGTLVHLVDVFYGWRVALQNQKDDGVLAEADFPDVATLKIRWEQERGAWTTYVAGLSDEQFHEIWLEKGSRRRTRWQTIMHVIIEGVYHRSEAAAMLTGYGHSPGEIVFESWLGRQE